MNTEHLYREKCEAGHEPFKFCFLSESILQRRLLQGLSSNLFFLQTSITTYKFPCRCNTFFAVDSNSRVTNKASPLERRAEILSLISDTFISPVLIFAGGEALRFSRQHHRGVQLESQAGERICRGRTF